MLYVLFFKITLNVICLIWCSMKDSLVMTNDIATYFNFMVLILNICLFAGEWQRLLHMSSCIGVK